MAFVALGVVTVIAVLLAAVAHVRRRALAAQLVHAQANETTLRAALEAASQFLWDGDLVTGRVSGSPEAGQWLGYPPEEWPPQPWHRIVHEEDRPAVEDAIRRAVRGETRTYRVRHRLRRKDGTVLHALSTGVVIRDGEGRATRFVGFVRDLTRENEEEEHRAHVQKLESLGVLAGGIAHDFNNLLAVVTSSLEVAARSPGTDRAAGALIATAREATEKAAVLTKQLLAYAGRTPITQRQVDLNVLVESMSALLGVTLSKRVRFTRVLDASAPVVLGEAGQLQQVVMNLITNAAEAIGDADGTVTLRTERDGGVVRLVVTDDGRGMSPEVQARIFDPFFSTKGQGRGLGLAAISGIVKRHSGAIRVESALGKGTTFTIELPATERAAAVEQSVASGPRSLSIPVLLVDDEP
ncbi:MAG: PAS domain-containing protein, partial [Myxococcaceae bacterium]|nr:PAS domain-containing protein [Myxococcaceae bacterium]